MAPRSAPSAAAWRCSTMPPSSRKQEGRFTSCPLDLLRGLAMMSSQRGDGHAADERAEILLQAWLSEFSVLLQREEARVRLTALQHAHDHAVLAAHPPAPQAVSVLGASDRCLVRAPRVRRALCVLPGRTAGGRGARPCRGSAPCPPGRRRRRW